MEGLLHMPGNVVSVRLTSRDVNDKAFKWSVLSFLQHELTQMMVNLINQIGQKKFSLSPRPFSNLLSEFSSPLNDLLGRSTTFCLFSSTIELIFRNQKTHNPIRHQNFNSSWNQCFSSPAQVHLCLSSLSNALCRTDVPRSLFHEVPLLILWRPFQGLIHLTFPDACPWCTLSLIFVRPLTPVPEGTWDSFIPASTSLGVKWCEALSNNLH